MKDFVKGIRNAGERLIDVADRVNDIGDKASALAAQAAERLNEVTEKTVERVTEAAEQFRQTTTENHIWVLVLNFELHGYRNYPLRAFSSLSAAETAAMRGTNAVATIHDTHFDDVIQRLEDRINRIKASKQWRDLVELSPSLFVNEPGDGFSISPVDLRYPVQFDVLKLDKE